MIRYYLDLAISGLTVIGRVWQDSPPNDIPHGSVRPAALWNARGMLKEWDDTDLGQHATRALAYKAIEAWHVQQAKAAS